MKKLIFSICVLSFMLTGFNQEERFVEQSDTKLIESASIIKEKPIIVQHLMNLAVNEGGIAVFLARFVPIDDPDIRVEWFYNGRPISTSDDRIESYLKEGYATLVINLVRPEDAGTYKVKIYNALGEVTSEATLIVTK